MTESKFAMARAVQWCPDGNILNGRPGEIQNLLRSETTTYGYAPSDGWSFVFYSEHGDVQVLPKQWVVRHTDGTFTVEDERPEYAEVRCGSCEVLTHTTEDHFAGRLD